MIRKVKNGWAVYSEKGEKLSKVYKSKKQARKRLQQIEYFKHKNQKYKRKVDYKMRDYGEIDYAKQTIRVNPKRGGLLNTILHEEEHRLHPRKSEKDVNKAAKRKEKGISVGEAIKFLKRYQRKRSKK